MIREKGLWALHASSSAHSSGKKLVLLTIFERLIFKKLIKMTISLSRLHEHKQ